MDESPGLAEVRAIFLGEAQDLLERIVTSGLRIEAADGEDPEALAALRRALHTLKGAAAAAHRATLRILAHAMEDVCEAPLRERATRQFLFQCVERLRAEVGQLRGVNGPPSVALAELLASSPVKLPAGVLREAAELGSLAEIDSQRPSVAIDPGGESHRVAGHELDRLHAAVVELQLSLARLETVGLARPQAQEVEGLRRQVQGCLELAQELRLVPVDTLGTTLRLAAQEVAAGQGKRVKLEFDSAGVRLERNVIEELREVLLHLVRNAVGHGIEAPAGREAAHKSPEGRVSVGFRLAAGELEASLEDDGAGIDREALLARAKSLGILPRDSADPVTPAQKLGLVFCEGLSTARTVDSTAGRGVGLGAARARIEALAGRLELASTPGRGTRFLITVPIRSSTLAAFLVGTRDAVWAIPAAAVVRVLPPRSVRLVEWAGLPCLELDGRQVAVHELAAILGLQSQADRDRDAPVLVLRYGEARVGLRVDAVVDHRDLAVRALGPRFAGYPLLLGVAVLGAGQLVPVLNPAVLFQRLEATSQAPPGPVAPPTQVLFVDDSLTMAHLATGILEEAGHRVLVARDGIEALELLRSRPVDLVVSDVEMPRMDGLELTRQIRGDSSLAALPVLLLTARDGSEFRTQGMAAGADAYLVKGRVDRASLKDAVRRLLP